MTPENAREIAKDLLERLEERAVAMEREGHVTVARYLRLAAGDIADLRDLLEQARKALTALYEACERRANEEGGDFGAAIGPAAELAEAALSASPSPTGPPVKLLFTNEWLRRKIETDPDDDVEAGNLSSTEDAATTLRAALQRFLAAVRALGRIKNGKTLFEGSPTKDDDCFQAWVELDRAGKQAVAALAKDETSEITRLRAENERLTGLLERMPALDLAIARAEAAEGERDTATRALADLDRLAWLAAEEDSWFGNENDIAVQRAAAERHRAALAKTEAKG